MIISKRHRALLKQAESPNQPPWNSGPSSNEGERTNITVKIPQKIVNIQMDKDRSKGQFDRRLMNWEMYNSMSDKILEEQQEENQKDAKESGAN
jgi:hypothetical protein